MEAGRLFRQTSAFLDLEFEFIGKWVYPYAPNHKLGTLVRYCGIYTDGTFHRALADAEITGNLWVAVIDEIKDSFGINHVSFELMQKLSRISKVKAPAFLEKIAGKQS